MSNSEKIIINKAQCKKCKDIIESKNINDFKRCSCGSIAVDGGLEYIKRIGNLDDVIELLNLMLIKKIYCLVGLT